MTPGEVALKRALPPYLADQLPNIEIEEKGGSVVYGEFLEKLEAISQTISPRVVVRTRYINHRSLAYSTPEKAITKNVTELPLSVQFWAIVTVLVGAVSAMLGVFVWQLVLALSTGSWATAWPVPVWGSLLSLCLFLTIAAGVKYRLLNGH